MQKNFFIHDVYKKVNKKDTPQSELLFKTVLYHNTSASGHSSRPQNTESTATVSATSPMPAGITIFSNLQIKYVI